MAIKSFGTTVTVGGSAIGGLLDVSVSGRDVTKIDVTSQGSAGNSREFIGGLIDNGSLELTGNYDADNAGQNYLEDNIGEVAAVVVTYSDGSRHNFSAVIGTPNVDGTLDDKVGFSCSLKITGAVTWTASS